MLLRVIAKNVGDVFLRHIVVFSDISLMAIFAGDQLERVR